MSLILREFVWYHAGACLRDEAGYLAFENWLLAIGSWLLAFISQGSRLALGGHWVELS